MSVQRVTVRVLVNESHLLSGLQVGIGSDYTRAESTRLISHGALAVDTYLSNRRICLFKLNLALLRRISGLADVRGSDLNSIELDPCCPDAPGCVSIPVSETTRAVAPVALVVGELRLRSFLLPSKSDVFICSN